MSCQQKVCLPTTIDDIDVGVAQVREVAESQLPEPQMQEYSSPEIQASDRSR